MSVTLQEQLTQLQQQIATEKQKGAEQDKFLVAQLETQEAALLEEITNQQVEQNHEVRVQQTQEQITYLLDSLEVDGISIRNLCISDTAYELQRAGVEEAVKKLIQPLTDSIKGFEEREQQLQRQNDRLQETIKQRETTIQTISEELNQTKYELEDSNQKRDAAVRATEQVEESLRLKQEELDLERAEKVLGAREAYKVVDTSEQIKQLAENFRKSQIRVTNIRWEDDLKKTFKLAELADTGETIRFHYFEQGKYLELTNDEVLQFRLEQLEKQNNIPDLPLGEPVEVTPPALEDVTQGQFREGAGDMEDTAASAEDTAGDSGQPVGGRYDQSVLVAEVATLKQTVDTLTADVEVLKRRVGWVA